MNERARGMIKKLLAAPTVRWTSMLDVAGRDHVNRSDELSNCEKTSRAISSSSSSSDDRLTTENATIQIRTNHVIRNEGVIHLTAETKARCSSMLICYACASCGGSQVPRRLMAVRYKSISHFLSPMRAMVHSIYINFRTSGNMSRIDDLAFGNVSILAYILIKQMSIQ